MTGIRVLLCSAMMLMAVTAQAAPSLGEGDADPPHGPLTGTVSIATGETFRGVIVPSGDPVFTGSLDYQFPSGVYVGGTAATNNLPGIDAELDLAAGYRRKDGPLSWDVGVVYYTYHGGGGSAPSEPNYGEINLDASYELRHVTVSASLSLTPPGFGQSQGAVSFSSGLEVPFDLTDDLSGAVSGNVGVQAERGVEDYVFWDAGVALYLNWFDVDVRYYATDIREAQLALRGFHSGHGQWIAEISKTF